MVYSKSQPSKTQKYSSIRALTDSVYFSAGLCIKQECQFNTWQHSDKTDTTTKTDKGTS